MTLFHHPPSHFRKFLEAADLAKNIFKHFFLKFWLVPNSYKQHGVLSATNVLQDILVSKSENCARQWSLLFPALVPWDVVLVHPQQDSVQIELCPGRGNIVPFLLVKHETPTRQTDSQVRGFHVICDAKSLSHVKAADKCAAKQRYRVDRNSRSHPKPRPSRWPRLLIVRPDNPGWCRKN